MGRREKLLSRVRWNAQYGENPLLGVQSDPSSALPSSWDSECRGQTGCCAKRVWTILAAASLWRRVVVKHADCELKITYQCEHAPPSTDLPISLLHHGTRQVDKYSQHACVHSSRDAPALPCATVAALGTSACCLNVLAC